jgi:glycosyltransferase involved in cell wall biosynthesis
VKAAVRILLFRPAPDKVCPEAYNLQELGLAKALIRRGHACDVAYFCGREKDHVQELPFADGSVRILWLHGFGFAREGFYPSLAEYAGAYDIIQVCEYTGFAACWLDRKYPEKTVHYHGPYDYRKNRGDILKAFVFDRTLLRLSRRENMVAAAKSVFAADYLKKRGIGSVTVTGVGLDPDALKEKGNKLPERDFVRRLREKKPEEKYLLYIGAMEPRRNILFLLEVFARAGKRMPELKLVLIGKGKEGYRKKCFRRIEELGIGSRVLYQERMEQQELPAVYRLCDGFLLPSRYEIFGMVLLEAMYFGLPVFTTCHGGSVTLLDGKNGRMLPETDAGIWADAIEELLRDPAAEISARSSRRSGRYSDRPTGKWS